MLYRDLIGKQIWLIGEQKICSDVQEFFSELTYERVEIVENNDEITEETLLALSGCDVLLLGVEREYVKTEWCLNVQIPVITLTNLFEIVDELETFYIDKMFNNRKICVFGKKENISELISSNPNLRVDYYLDTATEINNILFPFVIVVDDVNAEVKNKFTDLGLEFGKDFHFYNKRIPKKYTSFYLRKTLMDEPKYIIPCDYTTKALSIKAHGNVMACCSSVTLALGNYLYTSIEEVLRGIQAQLVCLSINNRTFSFCGEMCYMFREKKYCLTDEEQIRNNPRKNISLREIKDFNVQLGYDRSCNLACPSCRNHRITKPEDDQEIVEMMHDEVKRMCLKKPRNLRIGNGELFFSPYYKDIVFNQYKNEEIALISNGMLFNPENWSRLEERYKRVSLEVSIDAINPETYKKLRGGDLIRLRKNMEFAGELRKEGKLKRLSISFVIQVENFREMVGFVEYGRSINADFIHFMKLNSWGHIPEETFIQMDVYDERNIYHKEFVEILNNPIFADSKVHVDNIDNFLRKNKMEA